MRAAKSILGRCAAPAALCLLAGCWFISTARRSPPTTATVDRPQRQAASNNARLPRYLTTGTVLANQTAPPQPPSRAATSVRGPKPSEPANLAMRAAPSSPAHGAAISVTASVTSRPASGAGRLPAARGKLATASVVVGGAPVARPADPRTAYEHSGIVFRGRSDEILRAAADMRLLLAEMGWTAEQVRMEASPDGEQLRYLLNSSPGASGEDETDTLAIAHQPGLMLARDVIRYQDRLGQLRELSLVSRKEILATMLVPGRLFEFNGANCSVAQLREQIAVRQNIVYWGSRTDWVFPKDKTYRYNTADCWQPMTGDDWTLRTGMPANRAIADAFVGRFFYQIGCTSACRFIVAHGILDYFDRVDPDAAVAARLMQLLDPRHPFLEMAPVANRAGAIVQAGRLLDRHFDVPWNHWVPGDWGWIKNTDDRSSEELGSEGCNIIYGGGGLFVNYYPERPPKTLAQAISRVYGWRFGLEEEELKLEEAEFSLLRRDPREGGMLRDVRDFPKFFRSPPASTPGA
jgi:hypothetical protein